jgi:hypothetical protein
MPQYKGTLLFSYVGQPPVGFSESIEFTAETDTDARNKIASWPEQRKAWLASDWRIIGFRLALISHTSTGGICKAKYTPIQIAACAGNLLGDLGNAETPFAGVLFRVSFGVGVKRPRMYVGRGIPNTWWTAGALSIPPDEGGKFLGWFNFMRSQKAGAYLYNPKHALPCEPQFTRWFSYCTVRIASRRIGRPFGLIRGRKSKKKAVPPA